jgi:hypothetical protein
VSSSLCDEVPHIFIQKSHLEPREFLISSAKRLLQHNLPIADIRTSRPFRISYSDQAENPDLLQSGLAHAFDEFCHRAGSIGDIAFDPRNRIFGMQFLQSH